MSMSDILRKLTGGQNVNGEFSAKDGLTPDEVELEHYRRKEYLANVRQEVHKYREKNKQALWKGSPMKDDKHQIIKAKNVFKGQKRLFSRR